MEGNHPEAQEVMPEYRELDEKEFPEEQELEEECVGHTLYILHPGTWHTQLQASTRPHSAPIVGGQLP